MPRTTEPPIIGESPTTGARRRGSASRMPGDAEDRADRHHRVRRREQHRRPPPGSPRAPREPLSRSRPRAAGTRARAARLGCGPTTPRSAARRLGSVTTCVSTSSSVAGSRRTPSGQRAVSRSTTAESGSPSRSSADRAMWVPRSRSPRVNQGQPTPYAVSSALTRSDSPARPQPRTASFTPASAYMSESRSGVTRSPASHRSSPVFATTVIAGERAGSRRPRARRPRTNWAPPTPPARTTMRSGSTRQPY